MRFREIFPNPVRIFLNQIRVAAEQENGPFQGCKFASDFRLKRKATRSEAKFSLSLRIFQSLSLSLRIFEKWRSRFAFAQHKFLRFFSLFSLSLWANSKRISKLNISIFRFFAFVRANSERISSKNISIFRFLAKRVLSKRKYKKKNEIIFAEANIIDWKKWQIKNHKMNKYMVN